jgi:Flp pilus assembly protein TadG
MINAGSRLGSNRSAGRRRRRKGAAMVEMVMILPMFSFVLVASADFSRAFHDFVTITDSARNGSLYASQNPTLSPTAYQAGITAASTIDANGMKTVPTVTTNSGTLGPGNNYVDVTVSNPFNTLASYPGISSQITISRTIRMRVQPTTYRMK